MKSTIEQQLLELAKHPARFTPELLLAGQKLVCKLVVATNPNGNGTWEESNG